MNNKILLALAALVIIAGLAIYQVNKQGDDSGALDARKGAGDKLAQLDKTKVEELEVRVPGASPIIVRKQKGSWRITAPHDAEPNVSTVESAIDKLAEMSVRRVAATNPENHGTLEVDAEKGIQVIVRGGGEVLRDIVVGSFGGGEQMVRVSEQDPVLAVDTSLRWVFDKPLKDWRNKSITDQDPAQVTNLLFENGDARWAFGKVGDSWTQQEPKKPIEKFDATKVAGLASTLARLSAVDFAEPSLTPEQAGLTDGAAKVTLSLSSSTSAAAPTTVGDAGAAASDAGASTTPQQTTTQQVVLLVGNEKDGNTYLKRADSKLIYLVSSFNADKLKPTVETFQQSDEPEPQPGMAGPPGGIQMAPGQQGNIPPDVMAKIQAQLQAQGHQ